MMVDHVSYQLGMVPITAFSRTSTLFRYRVSFLRLRLANDLHHDGMIHPAPLSTVEASLPWTALIACSFICLNSQYSNVRKANESLSLLEKAALIELRTKYNEASHLSRYRSR
uniref:Uncharacterized protein n=1 Tax=Chaetoceros debilis TaxID=122233 RepID=A0A7S3QC77_9STRA